jgi:probable phosphoglycerate mutase
VLFCTIFSLHKLKLMTSTRILAIRHGETAWNAETRIQGHIDIPLNEHGAWQAQQLAKALQDEQIDAVYASDLDRAFTTAQAFATPRGLSVQALPALRERHLGDFQGQTWTEIESNHPEEALRWKQRDPEWTPVGGGESLLVLAERVQQFANHLASQHPDQHIAWVTHGGVLDVLYRLATGQSLQAARTWGLRNTAINRLLWTPQGLQLVGWADERHLDGQAREEKGA